MTLTEQVAALMRDVAAQCVMPRYQRLSVRDVAEKSPGEIVTIADREAELRLYDGLDALGLPARIIGEEAAARSPALLEQVGEGLVWLIDPLDGTGNFAAGRGPFGLMIALVEEGVPLEGWILDPVADRLCHARRGKGAFCNGRAVRASGTGNESPRAALGTHFMTPEQRERVQRCAGRMLDVQPVPRCAAESYARLVLGRDDIALFQRILPWDHAAGAVFLTEAGGVITHWDGAPYRVGGGKGVLAASTAPLWRMAAGVLLGDAADLMQTETIGL